MAAGRDALTDMYRDRPPGPVQSALRRGLKAGMDKAIIGGFCIINVVCGSMWINCSRNRKVE